MPVEDEASGSAKRTRGGRESALPLPLLLPFERDEDFGLAEEALPLPDEDAWPLVEEVMTVIVEEDLASRPLSAPLGTTPSLLAPAFKIGSTLSGVVA